MSDKNHNRLIFEKSPYLLQHADNPVDWYSWGQEAFEKAQNDDKPVFLSIGYSTCHWCHVMAHESFEDLEIAKLMNQNFISIKVDREERPDIDGIYITVCQLMTGSGGWPLTIIMSPDKKPFFAGTYIPKESKFGKIGMVDLIPRIKDFWINRKDELLKSANKVISALQRISQDVPGEGLNESTLKLAFTQLSENFDELHGGFTNAPKFPTPHNLLFLLRYWQRTRNEKALSMVEKTLRAMRQGGIYDHIGFGFHRYSTDNKWLVPHFEKMLYDQALLAIAFTEAYQATREIEYAKTAREIFTYVLRDMTDAKGGFYSAQDADSEDKEGKFYLWSENELKEILAREETNLAIKVFNIKSKGNFIEESTGKINDQNILYRTKSTKDIAIELKISERDLEDRLESIRRKLFAYRAERIHPLKDDKILTDWNGLMIASFAKGAQALSEDNYAIAAKRAADFILSNMLTASGKLLHRFRDGKAAIIGNSDDYAFLIWGLLELYETIFDAGYLKTAIDLSQIFIEHFWDDNNGGFYFTDDESENLIIRPKQIYDGALPSGNSVAMLNLLRLSRMTANPDFENKAIKLGQAFSRNVNLTPSYYTQLMNALDFAVGPTNEIVIVGNSQARDTKEMIKAIHQKYLTNKVLILRQAEQTGPDIDNIIPFMKNQMSIEDKATAYVCSNYNCDTPTADINMMLKLFEL
jgi:uncharacterized protein YyaL (SSP411 family)